MSKVIVAVYGSLKKGRGNHQHFLKDAEVIGEGVTQNKFKMLSMGAFPGLIDSTEPDNTANVVVEVYQVDSDSFKSLDRLEGYPHFYTRRQETILLSNDKKIQAWIYILAKDDRHGTSFVTPVDDVVSW